MITALGIGRAFASGAGDLARSVRRSVVEVRSSGTGSGSGVIWGGAGLVITNAHCTPRGAALEVSAERACHSARVIAWHPRHDLALLSVPSVRGPLLEIREADSLRPGELVFAHGHPLGVRDALAMGVVHGVAHGAGTDRPRWIIADIRLAPGNSGGPLVDADGRLVGINSMVANGLGIAVPAGLVARFVERALSERAA